MSESIKGNMFILTGVGQLRNIYGFIDQYNATDNIAVVFYTIQNLNVVNNIKSNMEEGYFKDVQYVQLPIKLLQEEKSKSKKIYNIFEELIKSNIEENNIKNLFLCMANDHYSLFEKICRKRNVSINLLEEGLATYRIFLEENNKKYYKVGIKDLAKNLKKVWKKLYKVFEPIIKLLKAIVELIINLISFITRINWIYYINHVRNKIKKYKYSLISKFDNVYVCYPKLMKKLNKDTTNVKKLRFNYKDEKYKFTSGKDTENVLFINQKFGVRYKEHFVIVFSILKDMGIKKVYIKFHPKEKTKDKDFIEIFEDAKAKFPEIEVITLNKLSHVPVENLINTNKITKLVGLTTSSLFYSKFVKKDLETISIAEEYEKRCVQLGVIKKRMKMFNQDFESFQRLFHVQQFDYQGVTNSLSDIDRE